MKNIQPTQADINYFQNHGEYSEEFKKRVAKADDVEELTATEETEEVTEEVVEEPVAEEETSEEDETWPKETGGGWFQLSNGKKVQGEEKAMDMQAEIDLA